MAIDLRQRSPRRWRVIGLLLLLAIAAVHVGAYPDQVEVATYLGALFLVNAAVALCLGAGIIRGNRCRDGCHRGLCVASCPPAPTRTRG